MKRFPSQFINQCGRDLVMNNPLCNYTILSLQFTKLDDDVLISLCKRTESHKDEKVIADMFDHLLQYNCTIKEANRLLKELGGGMKTLDSSQNAHMVTADVDNWLIQLWNVSVNNIKVDQVINEVKEMWGEEEAVVHSLNRIEMDNSVYGKLNMRLVGIFVRVWCKIQTHEHKDTCLQRLREELIEMAETCTTGHLLRLMNVFTGIEDNGLSIDPSIELKSVIMKRIETLMNSYKGKKEEKKKEQIIPQTLLVRKRILHGGEEDIDSEHFNRDDQLNNWKKINLGLSIIKEKDNKDAIIDEIIPYDDFDTNSDTNSNNNIDSMEGWEIKEESPSGFSNEYLSSLSSTCEPIDEVIPYDDQEIEPIDSKQEPTEEFESLDDPENEYLNSKMQYDNIIKI